MNVLVFGTCQAFLRLSASLYPHQKMQFGHKGPPKSGARRLLPPSLPPSLPSSLVPAIPPLNPHVLELGTAHVLEGEDIEGGEGVEGLTELGDGAGFLLAAFAGGLGQGHLGEGWRGGREGGWGRVSGEHASRIGRRSFASVIVLCPYLCQVIVRR